MSDHRSLSNGPELRVVTAEQETTYELPLHDRILNTLHLAGLLDDNALGKASKNILLDIASTLVVTDSKDGRPKHKAELTFYGGQAQSGSFSINVNEYDLITLTEGISSSDEPLYELLVDEIGNVRARSYEYQERAKRIVEGILATFHDELERRARVYDERDPRAYENLAQAG